MGKLRKFMALPWYEMSLYLETVCCLIGVKIGLCLLPFERMRRWAARFDHVAGESAEMEEMRAIIEAIDRVGQFLAPLQVNCLPQALVGQRLLGYRGFNVKLKIGVLKNFGDQLVAHAWLEYQGRVVLGDLNNLEQFAPLSSLGSTRL